MALAQWARINLYGYGLVDAEEAAVLTDRFLPEPPFIAGNTTRNNTEINLSVMVYSTCRV